MNDEIAQLKKRIVELERVNAELMRENEALKGKDKPQSETQQSRDKPTQILQYLCENRLAVTTSQIASRVNITQSLAQYHLDHLTTNGFVTRSSSGGTTGSAITARGRELLMGG